MAKEYEANRYEDELTRAMFAAIDDSHLPYSASSDGDFSTAEIDVNYPGYEKPAVIKIRQDGRRMAAVITRVSGKTTREYMRTYADMMKVLDETIPAVMVQSESEF